MVPKAEDKVVVIDGWSVSMACHLLKQDKDGLFCLNDVHKASGGMARHKPSEWLRLDSAKALVAEVEAGNPALKPVYIRKGYGVTGTYAVKEHIDASVS